MTFATWTNFSGWIQVFLHRCNWAGNFTEPFITNSITGKDPSRSLKTLAHDLLFVNTPF